MNTENDHEYFRAEQLEQREKATRYRLQRDGTERWVPNKLHEYRNGVLEVEAWFAQKEGMGA